MDRTDEAYEALRAKLRSRLTNEFLTTLVDAADLTMFDGFEVSGFVVECFQMAGKELPEQLRRQA